MILKSSDKALINYYARLVNKGNYKIEDVPEKYVSHVEKALIALKEEESEESDS